MQVKNKFKNGKTSEIFSKKRLLSAKIQIVETDEHLHCCIDSVKLVLKLYIYLITH